MTAYPFLLYLMEMITLMVSKELKISKANLYLKKLNRFKNLLQLQTQLLLRST